MQSETSVHGRARQALDRMVGDLKQAAGNLQSPLEAEITTLERAADEKLARDSRNLAAVHEALGKARAFFARAYNMEPNFNDVFWTSPEGQLIAEAAQWVYQDDLIDLTAAAGILYNLARKEVGKAALMRMNSFVRGPDPRLTLYVLPGIPLTRAKRVPKPEVETLKRTLAAQTDR